MDGFESALLERSQQRDFDAFAQLQACLEPDVRRFVHRLVGDHADTDDIVQTVFITLYRHIDQITPTEKLRPFVYRVARNRCYDELRARQRSDTLSMDDDALEVHVSFRASAKEPSPEDVVHWLLLKLEVQNAMDKLPELQRQTLILYAEEGLSYAEIAEVMATSIGTVKSRLHHAKQTLRRMMHPDTLREIDDDAQRPAERLEPDEEFTS